MDNQDFSQFHLAKKHFLFAALSVVLIVFVVVLIVSTIVEIQNKIKSARYIGQSQNVQNAITISDTGEVYVKPDLAQISFSVVTEAATVKEVMDNNAKIMNDVIDAVKAKGVEQKDLKTTTFNIQPRYEYREDGQTLLYGSGKRVLVGYEITQTLQAKIRDLERVGDIISAATASGANEVSALVFTVDQQDEYKKEARAQAIEKAKSKAEELALQLGIKLGRISSFSESSYDPWYYADSVSLKNMGVGGAASQPQIETGENKISVTVSITYEIQ